MVCCTGGIGRYNHESLTISQPIKLGIILHSPLGCTSCVPQRKIYKSYLLQVSNHLGTHATTLNEKRMNQLQLVEQIVESRYLTQNQLECLLRDLFGEGQGKYFYKVG